MKVVYLKEEDGSQLGQVEHTSFDRIMIPAKTEFYDIYIKQVFASEGKSKNTWRVVEVKPEGGVVTISLQESDSVTSVAEFAKAQSKSIAHYTKEFRIVEVDFGFHSNLISNDGSIGKNYHNSYSLLPGEMHKRRPCITLKTKGDQVQVIPLTSRVPNQSDKLSVPISSASFRKMAPRYSAKNSYALINMIQTVSAYRVHPPRGDNFNFEHNYHLYRLDVSDKNAVKEALSEQYSEQLVQDKRLGDAKNEQLSHERARLLDQIRTLKDEKLELEKKVQLVESDLRLLADFLGAGEDLDYILGR